MQLTLLNMFSELSYWSSWILELLLQNPTLEHLSFSIGDQTKWAINDDDKGLYNGAYPYRTFFSGLCRKYARRTSIKLALRSLRLEQPIEFPKLSTLSKLTVDILTPDATPSLDRLTISTFSWYLEDFFVQYLALVAGDSLLSLWKADWTITRAM